MSLDQKQRQGIYEKLRECVIVHHQLIWYSEKMEQIFMYTTLCQLLVSGIMLCVAGFQVFLVSTIVVLKSEKERERKRGSVSRNSLLI